MEQQLYKKIRALFHTFPQIGTSGRLTIRMVDEDVFLEGILKILEEYKRSGTENPV